MDAERKKRRFRLIDLIVVIVVLIVLAIILLPSLDKVQDCCRRSQCASNLKYIGLGLTMFANDNDKAFPTDTVTNSPMRALNSLFPDYISERKVFFCQSDALVSVETNAGITAATKFKVDQCSYGYDDTGKTLSADSGVALASDRPPTIVNDINNSPNHGDTPAVGGNASVRGQYIVYIDGHVEFVTSPIAGWYDADGNRENIWTLDKTGDTGGATDSYIRHDGK